MLVKSLSVYFSVDTIVTSQDILEAFDNTGIEIDFIRSIQRRSSNRTWVVSFDSQLAKKAALETASVEIAGSTVSWVIVRTVWFLSRSMKRWPSCPTLLLLAI